MNEVPIPESPTRPASQRKGPLERLQPVLALVIAFAAIGLATWEGAENRRHNRLSVQPRLGAEVDAGRTSQSEYVRLVVESNGLGPAVFRTFRIYFDGVVQDSVTAAGVNPWRTVIAAVSDSVTQINAHAFGAGYYFPVGRREVLFEAVRPGGISTAGEPLADILTRLAVQVCYCSIYDTDCDEVVLTAGDLKPLPCID